MALLSLPPELVSQIFEYVGAAFFKQGTSRLTISRQWYAVARRGIFRDITLRATTLRKLLSLQESMSETLLRSLAYMETLQLKLAGCEESVELGDRDGLSAVLNADLAALAPIIIEQALRLTSLSIRAPVWAVPQGDGHLIKPYLAVPTVCALLQIPIQLRLEVLVLDITSNLFSPPPAHHICSVIGSLLPTLRKLHVRMANICPEALVPPEAVNGEKLKLEEVVVNTSLKDIDKEQSGQTGVYHARPCSHHRNSSLRWLWESLYEKAELLAAQMEAPKTVRILKHQLPIFKIVSMDVLTGNEMKLTDDQAWSEDGEVIQDDAESESSISSISDF